MGDGACCAQGCFSPCWAKGDTRKCAEASAKIQTPEEIAAWAEGDVAESMFEMGSVTHCFCTEMSSLYSESAGTVRALQWVTELEPDMCSDFIYPTVLPALRPSAPPPRMPGTAPQSQSPLRM